MKQIDGNDITPLEAAKKIFIESADMVFDMTDEQVATAINMNKLTENQSKKIDEQLSKVSARVHKLLKIKKIDEK